MLKQIDYIKPFLMLIDDDDGHDIVRYINAHQIIDIEVNQLTLSILVRDDIEYTYKLDKLADASVLVYVCSNCFLNDHNCNYEIEKNQSSLFMED